MRSIYHIQRVPTNDHMQEMVIPKHAEWIKDTVRTFSPTDNHVTLASGRSIGYEYLIVAAGLQINWNAIKGLSEALVDSTSGVSSIYSYDTCAKTATDIEALRSGKAIFTQPAGVIKCAGGMFPIISRVCSSNESRFPLSSPPKSHVASLGPLQDDGTRSECPSFILHGHANDVRCAEV